MKVPDWAKLILGVLFPCLGLAWYHGNFYVDWSNHVWSVGCFGRYFREHLSMPIVLNTRELIGLAFPVFYGTLFYPILGIFASILSADLVVRVAAVLVLLLQTVLIYQAFLKVSSGRMAVGVALLAAWTVYPLTNLYNRAALTEFFAVALLTGGLACAFRLSQESDPRRQAWQVQLCGLLLTLASGTHPITAVFGLLFMASSVVFLLPDLRAPLSRGSIAVTALLACVVLLPWLYAMHLFGSALSIAGQPHLIYFPDSIDSWLTRFFPIPFDKRMLGPPLGPGQTPYLDAQLNLPLLFLDLGLGLLLVSQRKGLRKRFVAGWFVAGAALAGWVFFSVSELGNALLPNLLKMAQYAYRMVTYQNLSLLALAWFALRALPRTLQVERSRVMGWALSVALVFAAIQVPLKLQHALYSFFPDPEVPWLAEPDSRLVSPPYGRFYGWYDYGTPSLYQAVPGPLLPQGLPLSPVGASEFGGVQAVRYSLPTASWVKTNVSPFAWSQLYLDGILMASEDLAQTEGHYLVARLPAGTHKVSYGTSPDPVWAVLRGLSEGVLFLWTSAIIAGFFLIPRRTARLAQNSCPTRVAC